MNRISTHILDMNRGKPASNVPVTLQRNVADVWQPLNSARTDHDGRCAQLLPNDDLPPGIYRLTFDTATYFAALKTAALYPVVEITFQAHDGESHFHIPLLLSANGYTTYRGT
jgi:5-hydroxyisourate hydrolase